MKQLELKASIVTSRGVVMAKPMNLPYESIDQIKDADIAALIDDSHFPMIPNEMIEEFKRVVTKTSRTSFEVEVTSRNLTHLKASITIDEKG